MQKQSTFDLTTPAGVIDLLFPVHSLLYHLGEKWVARPSDVSPAKQMLAAERIIHAAREHGVHRIRIKIGKDAGMQILGQQPESGVSIDGSIGANDTMELDVEVAGGA